MPPKIIKLAAEARSWAKDSEPKGRPDGVLGSEKGELQNPVQVSLTSEPNSISVSKLQQELKIQVSQEDSAKEILTAMGGRGEKSNSLLAPKFIKPKSTITTTEPKEKTLVPNQELQILILGGGPAGSATAIGLANYLHSHGRERWFDHVALVEAQDRILYDKPCGGFITHFGLRALESLGVPLIFPHQKINQIALSHTGRVNELGVSEYRQGQRERAKIRIPYPDFGLVIQRQVFDEHLRRVAEQRGITVASPMQAVAIENRPYENFFRVTLKDKATRKQFEVKARMVVGADGAKGPSRKLVLKEFAKSLPEQKIQRGVAWRANLPVSFLDPRLRIATDEVALNFLNLGGEMTYDWAFSGKTQRSEKFPDGRLINVGFGHFSMDTRFGKTPRKVMEGLFPDYAAQLNNKNQGPEKISIDGGPIPYYNTIVPPAFFPQRQSLPALLLAGDAVGLASPISGEGIGQALYMGEILGGLLGQATGNFPYEARRALEKYPREVQLTSKVAALGRVEHQVSRLVVQPHRFRAFWNTLKRDPKNTAKFAADIITGEVPNPFKVRLFMDAPGLGLRLMFGEMRHRLR